jgi:hypothetical protein
MTSVNVVAIASAAAAISPDRLEEAEQEAAGMGNGVATGGAVQPVGRQGPAPEGTLILGSIAFPSPGQYEVSGMASTHCADTGHLAVALCCLEILHGKTALCS